MLNKPSLTRGALKAGVASVVLSFGLASAAYAQAVPAEGAQTAQQGTAAAVPGEEIVVTGTLIRNPNLESSSPVAVIGQDEIELQQATVAEELLRELPGAVPSIGSAVNNGNGGASYVNLRGIGSNRNVVLLDGVRVAPADLQGRFDLNNVPLALIQRTDVLTGGASTTYGADAIGGVVNFITRKNFEGAELSASQQLTERGDGNRFRIDAVIGGNFADGKGNAVFSIGYQEVDPVYQGDRSFSVNNIDSYTGAAGGSGTAIPSRFTGTRPFIGGVINTAAPFTQTGSVPNPAFNPAQPVSPTNQPTIPVLAANGAGAANGGQRQLNPATGQAIANFSAFNFNPFNIFQTPFERFNMFGQANYEIADGVEVYTRGLFSRNTVQTIIAPSGVFNSSVVVPLNNPFLPAALRDQFCAFNVAPTVTGVNAAGQSVAGQIAYTPRFTPAECAAAANPNLRPGDAAYREVTTNLSRRTTEVGPRISDFQTTIYDMQLGLRGTIGDALNWDVFGSYGESENRQALQNYVLTSRVRQSLLAGGTAANPVCFNPANGCVPTNFFGPEGSITSASSAFIAGAEATTLVRTTQSQVRGTLSGDVGFSSPFANDQIGFAVGGEYRKYTASQRPDTLSQQAGELGGAGGAAPFIEGGFDVKEAFGEIIAPLVQDAPFFNQLTLEAGIRYSSYNVDAPGNPSFDTTTWKAGLQWEPFDGLKLRGNYARAVRAPNIGELFSPVNTTLTNLATDPCAGSAPVANATLRAVCLAQGAPAGTIGSIQNPTAGQANTTGGGNVNLRPEVADTWSAGFVFQPTFVPGLTLAVDYFDIRVNGAVSNPTPADVIGACFGSSPTNPPAGAATNPACTVIRRNPVTGGLDGDPATTPGLFQTLSNLGRIETSGVDLTANYTTQLGESARLSLGFVGTYNRRNLFQATPTALNRECIGFYSVNCASIQPKYQFSQRTTLSFDNVDISLLWRFLDKVRFEPQQLADDIAAAREDPNGCPDPTGTDPGGCVVNPEFRTIKAYHYLDLSVRFGIVENMTLTLTVDNLLDKQPPLVGSTAGSTAYNSGNTYPSTYDSLGRRYAAALRLRF